MHTHTHIINYTYILFRVQYANDMKSLHTIKVRYFPTNSYRAEKALAGAQ